MTEKISLKQYAKEMTFTKTTLDVMFETYTVFEADLATLRIIRNKLVIANIEQKLDRYLEAVNTELNIRYQEKQANENRVLAIIAIIISVFSILAPLLTK